MLVPKGGIIGDVVEVYLFIYFLSPCFFYIPICLFGLRGRIIQRRYSLVYAGNWGRGGWVSFFVWTAFDVFFLNYFRV